MACPCQHHRLCTITGAASLKRGERHLLVVGIAGLCTITGAASLKQFRRNSIHSLLPCLCTITGAASLKLPPQGTCPHGVTLSLHHHRCSLIEASTRSKRQTNLNTSLHHHRCSLIEAGTPVRQTFRRWPSLHHHRCSLIEARYRSPGPDASAGVSAPSPVQPH